MTTHPASAHELAQRIASGELRATDVTEQALRRCAAVDADLGCFVEYFAAAAMEQAEAVDRARANSEPLGPLAGVPVAIKDNLLCRGQIASCGSNILDGFRAPYSSAAVERLLAAGAVLLGRTNMDEFGMGSSTEHSAFGPTRNPFDRERVPGGSSGGSAAAIAADLCPLALGSDTGGSVRQPAALCGVTGLKPTYGRISRYGLVAYASSLDTIGVLARTAEDVALALSVLAGPDPRDATSVAALPADHRQALRADGAPPVLGIVPSTFTDGVDAEVAQATHAAVELLRELGMRTRETALPHLHAALPAYYLIATAEASANLARYDGVRYGLRQKGQRLEAMMANSRSAGFGAEVQLRILLGTFALRAGYQDELYGKASRVRTLLRTDFASAFAQCDLLVMPTSPVPAFPLRSHIDDPAAMYACDLLTVPASLAGLPAISLPCGHTQAGLPVGLQLIAPPLREDLLLSTADRFQQASSHHLRRPHLEAAV